MAPVLDKAPNDTHFGVRLRANDNVDETDEGFVSPSVQRISIKRKENRESDNSASSSSEDNDSQPESTSSSSGVGLVNTDAEEDSAKVVPVENTNKENILNSATDKISVKDAAEAKAESLAKFIVHSLLKNESGDTNDKIQRTLLRCVRMMMQKHEILLKGMMKRLQVTRETGYVAFVTVANTLFEDEKRIITWSRIIALYAFGGQLALYCKEKDMEDFAYTIATFLGKYSKECLTPFVMNEGGWVKICEEFPEESDIENKIRKVLSWTAVGLGVAATVSYLTSR